MICATITAHSQLPNIMWLITKRVDYVQLAWKISFSLVNVVTIIFANKKKTIICKEIDTEFTMQIIG